MMADTSVSERRIRPIDEAANAGNWKQALKECEKWHKKGEKSDKFQALKAYVLVQQVEQAQKDKGQSETLQLCRRTPPLTDVEAIQYLRHALGRLTLLKEEGTKLYDRAAAAMGADGKDLMTTWLHNSVANNDWQSAQKAAMAFKRAFPKERKYDFWNILMCFLIFDDFSVEEKQKQMFGTLAYRMLAKAAEAIPLDPDQLLSPGKAIATPEELYLLFYVYSKTGHSSEAVDLLTGPLCGASSRLGQQDPHMTRDILLISLEQSQRWDSAFLLCSILLKTPENAADDRVWDLLLKSAATSSGLERREELERILTEFTDPERLHNRSAFVARLKYASTQVRTNSVPSGDLLSLCISYFLKHEGTQYCWLDVAEPLCSLDAKDQEAFRAFLTKRVEEMLVPWNDMFLLRFDRNVNPLPHDVTGLLVRARAGIEHYQSSLSRGSINVTGAQMAALDLLHASRLSGKVEFILRAITLLELCHSRHEDAFAISVLLIECYLKVGLGSQALDLFAKLSVKNLQWESVGHILLTRISSSHPHDSGTEEQPLDPLAALDDALLAMKRWKNSVDDGIMGGLRTGSYSNIMNSVQMKSDLHASYNKWFYRIERQRIKRLYGGDLELMPEIPSMRLHDKRDYSFYTIFAENDRELHPYLSCGPKPTGTYLWSMLWIEHVVAFLRYDLAGDKEKADMAYARIQFGAVFNAFSAEDFRKDLTKIEMFVLESVLSLRRIMHWVKEERQLMPELVSKYVKDVEGCLGVAKRYTRRVTQQWESDYGLERTVRGKVKIPVWDYLHESYCQLDLCQILSLFLEWMEKQGKTKTKAKTATNAKQQQTPEVSEMKVWDILTQEMKDFGLSNEETNGIGDATKTESTLGSTSSESDGKTVDNDDAVAILDKNRLHDWARKVEELELEVRESALQVIESLSQKGVTQMLADVAFAHDEDEKDEKIKEENEKWEKVMNMLCEGEKESKIVERVCERFRQGWEDAVDGILRVKVGRRK